MHSSHLFPADLVSRLRTKPTDITPSFKNPNGFPIHLAKKGLTPTAWKALYSQLPPVSSPSHLLPLAGTTCTWTLGIAGPWHRWPRSFLAPGRPSLTPSTTSPEPPPSGPAVPVSAPPATPCHWMLHQRRSGPLNAFCWVPSVTGTGPKSSWNSGDRVTLQQVVMSTYCVLALGEGSEQNKNPCSRAAHIYYSIITK